MRVPEGFVHETSGRASLLAAADCAAAVHSAGLASPAAWERILRDCGQEAGRGRIARLTLPGGPRVVVKQLRRGGASRHLWRDRFAGTGRALANVEVPIEAAARGVPTARPVALLLVRDAWGTSRAWLATEEIAGAEDLPALYRRGLADPAALTVAMLDQVRSAHDAGLNHPDLNLGNLLARPAAAGAWDVFVVDLDGARLRPGPLGFRARLSALRRLERSAVKQFGPGGPPGAGGTGSWYGVYARGDAALARRLEAARPAGRAWLALHRLGRKGSSSATRPAQRSDPR